jgi:DNA-binding CsgD family transcriptional regulator
MTNTARTLDKECVGLVLMDLSLKSVAFDRGAALLLGYASKPGITGINGEPCIPKEILDMVRGRKAADLSFAKTYFRVGESEYVCRVHVMELPNRLCKEPLLALYLEKAAFVNGAVYDVATRYHLTVREAEILRGISTGLAPKEVAKRLNISPNTVKSFLRLIMTKMGVTTRAEMFAMILEHKARFENQFAVTGPSVESNGSFVGEP